jgi:hypothetical protein
MERSALKMEHYGVGALRCVRERGAGTFITFNNERIARREPPTRCGRRSRRTASIGGFELSYRQPGYPRLARASGDHQHHHLHGVGAEPLQGLLATLAVALKIGRASVYRVLWTSSD